MSDGSFALGDLPGNLFGGNLAAVISPDGEKLLGRPLTRPDQHVFANKAAFV